MESRSAAETVELIQAARDGCSESLGALLQSYQSYLRLIAQLHLDGRLMAKCSPSDVVQETFAQAQRGFSRFAGGSEGELIGWLRKILANEIAMQTRRFQTKRRDIGMEMRINAAVDESSAMLGAVLPARGRTPSQSAARRERAVLLADALSQLPADYRQVIVMRHLQGLSFADVAQRLDRSVDSVKGVWRRALARLRTLIDVESI